MIRIGVVDFDTSHSVELTKRVNHVDIDEAQWIEGASVGGMRKGSSPYGFTLFGEKAVATRGVDTQFIYRDLLMQVVLMFATKEMPIDLREMLEIVAFMEAAKTSADGEGTPVEIKI